MLNDQNINLSEIFKKMIAELEGKQEFFCYDDSDYGEAKYTAYEDAIKIAKQTAHDYGIRLIEESEKEEER